MSKKQKKKKQELRAGDRVWLFIASGFGPGFLRPFAGTWGSLLPLLCAWLLMKYLSPWFYAATTAAVVFIGVLSADRAEKHWGKDSHTITIDEFAGMLITMIGLPTIGWVYLVGFVVFRIVDVVKPPPALQLENLRGGMGVVIDDIIAGIYSNIIMRVIIFFALNIRPF